MLQNQVSGCKDRREITKPTNARATTGPKLQVLTAAVVFSVLSNHTGVSSMLAVCSKENLRLGSKGPPAPPTPAASRRHQPPGVRLHRRLRAQRARRTSAPPTRSPMLEFLALPGNCSHRKAVPLEKPPASSDMPLPVLIVVRKVGRRVVLCVEFQVELDGLVLDTSSPRRNTGGDAVRT